MAEPGKNKKNGPKKKARDEFNEGDVFEAPAITREPSSRQANLGGKVVLRISASGRPLPNFQWYHNGKKIVGANSDRLTLSKLRRQDAGSYQCEAKNFVGKAMSRAAMLSFFTQRIPKLVIGPENLVVEEGKPFQIKLLSPSPSDLKAFKIYWMFNGMRIKGASGFELEIGSAKKKYEGEYKAVISTGSGLESSNVVKVKLGQAKAAAEKPAPDIQQLNQPEPQIHIEEAKPIQTKNSEPWEDFLFNPEDEESDTSASAPAPDSDLFGNTSPGDPIREGLPVSQLATKDLIREVAAHGGASDLIEKISEDPSSWIGQESTASEVNDPSGLLENIFSISGDTPDPKSAQKNAAVKEIRPAPVTNRPANPVPTGKQSLIKKKEFLEKALAHFSRGLRKAA